MKPQPGGGNQMMMGDGAFDPQEQRRRRQVQMASGAIPSPGQRPNFGNPAFGNSAPDIQQLQQRMMAMPNKQQMMANIPQLPPQAQGMPGRAMPNLQGLGNIDALMQQRQMGAGGMNPFAQRLQQTGMNPALQNTVTAPVRPTGMEDRTPFAPRLRFNNPMQQGPANPEDAQRSRMQQALAGFGRFRNRGQ